MPEIGDQETRAHLSGDSFSSGFRLATRPGPRHPLYRNDYLRETVRGRTVLHVGCLDHPSLIEQRHAGSGWLHAILTDAATDCLGLDIDRDGLAIADRLGFDNILLHDVLADPPRTEIAEHRWDYAVLADVLEHLDSPVSFLREFGRKYGACVGEVIVTVPNAFRAANFRNALRSFEVVNSDHRYWFTPYTLAKVLALAGMPPEALTFCQHTRIARRDLLTKLLVRYRPQLRETLVAHAETAGRRAR